MLSFVCYPELGIEVLMWVSPNSFGVEILVDVITAHSIFRCDRVTVYSIVVRECEVIP